LILAIDPGCTESAYVVIDEQTLKPVEFAKVKNELLLGFLYGDRFTVHKVDKFAIEMVACYGMPVGKEVFDTVLWVGRYFEIIYSDYDNEAKLIYRKDEKINLCGTMKAKDSNIIQALIDRFAYNVQNKGKGTKKNPGWFYGFSKDIWQAYAVGVTYHDLYLNKPNLIQNATQDKLT
jgi:hypothetical protein